LRLLHSIKNASDHQVYRAHLAWMVESSSASVPY
jgi:hypothetical protein